MLTKAKLEKFIKVRNASGFNSNLQFQIDAGECGFKVADLGDIEKVEEGVYRWNTPFGVLEERHGRLAVKG